MRQSSRSVAGWRISRTRCRMSRSSTTNWNARGRRAPRQSPLVRPAPLRGHRRPSHPGLVAFATRRRVVGPCRSPNTVGRLQQLVNSADCCDTCRVTNTLDSRGGHHESVTQGFRRLGHVLALRQATRIARYTSTSAYDPPVGTGPACPDRPSYGATQAAIRRNATALRVAGALLRLLPPFETSGAMSAFLREFSSSWAARKLQSVYGADNKRPTAGLKQAM